jgi:hypothetical protein
MYVNVDMVVKYFNQNGISNSDFGLLFEASGFKQLEEFLKEFGFSFFDVNEAAFWGNINLMNPQQIATFSAIIKLKGAKATLPSEILKNYENTQHGKIYFLNEQKTICITLLGDTIIIGDKSFVSDHLRGRAAGRRISSPEARSLQRQIRGKMIFGMLAFNDTTKITLNALLTMQSSRIRGLDQNVFLRSLIATNKFEISIFQDRRALKSQFVMTSPTAEDAQRMLMITHAFLVASSFVMYAMEQFLPEISESLGFDEEMHERYIANVQRGIATAQVNRRRRVVTLTSENTESEMREEFNRLKERVNQIEKDQEKKDNKTELDLLSDKIKSNDVNISDFEKSIKRLSDIDGLNSAGNTLLIIAVQNNNLELVKLILGNEASINKFNRGFRGPLYFAVVQGNFEITNYLLNNGADVNVGLPIGQNLLHVNATEGNPQIAQLALKHVRGINVINARDENGETPLFIAAAQGNFDAVKIYCEAGADNDIRNDKGLTPMDIAKQNDNEDIVNYLLEKLSEIK